MPSSPTCQVKLNGGSYQPTTNGINANPGDTVTIALASPNVRSWLIQCATTDDLSSAATVNAGMVIDPIGKTATFTYPDNTVNGRALRFLSQVDGGIGANQTAQPSLTTTFAVYSLTTNGRRVLAADERFESDPLFGWGPRVNAIIRGPSPGELFVDPSTGTTYGVAGTAYSGGIQTTDTTPSNVITVPWPAAIYGDGTVGVQFFGEYRSATGGGLISQCGRIERAAGVLTVKTNSAISTGDTPDITIGSVNIVKIDNDHFALQVVGIAATKINWSAAAHVSFAKKAV